MSCKILVTGGAGFIGSAVAKRMIQLGHSVSIVDNLVTGLKRNIPDGADFMELDISRQADIDKLPRDVDTVLHFAAQSSGEISYDKPMVDLETNVIGTYLLLHYCKENDIRRFIFSSTMSVYGEPVNLPMDENHPVEPQSYYGATKLAAEKYVNIFGRSGMDITNFRLFSIYGPGQNMDNMKQGIASIYMAYIMKNEPVFVKGQLDRFRDLLFIDDVVEAYEIALDNEKTYGQLYNLGTGRKTTVRELIDSELEAFGYNPGEYEVIQGEPTPNDTFGVTADITKIKTELGWEPKFSVADGLKKMAAWVKELSDHHGN